MNEFKDCEYRYVETEYDETVFYCENKYDKDNRCDNCKNNVHLNCDHYNPKKDFCLKFFEHDASTIAECKEKSVFTDKALSIVDSELCFDGSTCTYCESCMDVCPECAIRIYMVEE